MLTGLPETLFRILGMTMISQDVAISLPPATAKPWTWLIVGLSQCHDAKKSSVVAFVRRWSSIGTRGISWT
jgi:hypothetical protein